MTLPDLFFSLLINATLLVGLTQIVDLFMARRNGTWLEKPGWALGLFGQLNRPQLYIVVVLAWALMLAWSKPWLDRYRYGPLEWLWRCLTYRTVFPLKK